MWVHMDPPPPLNFLCCSIRACQLISRPKCRFQAVPSWSWGAVCVEQRSCCSCKALVPPGCTALFVFRALKTKGNTPKYGLIFHSTFIGRAAAKNKGRISRYLANKCSIASRIDCFSGESHGILSGCMRDVSLQLEGAGFSNDALIFRQQYFTYW